MKRPPLVTSVIEPFYGSINLRTIGPLLFRENKKHNISYCFIDTQKARDIDNQQDGIQTEIWWMRSDKYRTKMVTYIAENMSDGLEKHNMIFLYR